MGTVLVGYCLGCEGGVVQGVRLNGTSFRVFIGVVVVGEGGERVMYKFKRTLTCCLWVFVLFTPRFDKTG